MFKCGNYVDANMHEEYYFISVNEKYNNIFINHLDTSIAIGLKLSLKEYIKILKKFNAFINKNDEYVFKNEEDCLQCIEYLNDTYGILIALI